MKNEERTSKGKAQEGHLKISVSQNTGFVQFAVSDDGAGIDPENMIYIFIRYVKSANMMYIAQ